MSKRHKCVTDLLYFVYTKVEMIDSCHKCTVQKRKTWRIKRSKCRTFTVRPRTPSLNLGIHQHLQRKDKSFEFVMERVSRLLSLSYAQLVWSRSILGSLFMIGATFLHKNICVKKKEACHDKIRDIHSEIHLRQTIKMIRELSSKCVQIKCVQWLTWWIIWFFCCRGKNSENQCFFRVCILTNGEQQRCVPRHICALSNFGGLLGLKIRNRASYIFFRFM